MAPKKTKMVEITRDHAKALLSGASDVADYDVTVGLFEMQERRFTKRDRFGGVSMHYIYKYKKKYYISNDGRGGLRLPISKETPFNAGDKDNEKDI